jgi:hypothetical protein
VHNLVHASSPAASEAVTYANGKHSPTHTHAHAHTHTHRGARPRAPALRGGAPGRTAEESHDTSAADVLCALGPAAPRSVKGRSLADAMGNKYKQEYADRLLVRWAPSVGRALDGGCDGRQVPFMRRSMLPLYRVTVSARNGDLEVHKSSCPSHTGRAGQSCIQDWPEARPP